MADALNFQEALEQLKPTATPEEATEETPETVEAETPEEIEIEEDGKEEVPAAEMPASWSKDDNEIWQSLAPDAQNKVVERERQTQSDYSRRQNELSDQQKALHANEEKTKQKQAELLETLKAVQVQKPSPDMLDPNHESHDSDEYHRQNALWEKSTAKVTELSEEIQKQQTEDFAKWQGMQAELYKKDWPEFLDTEKGPKLHNDLIGFAAKRMRISAEQAAQVLQTTDYRQMSILNDAMKYGQAIEKAKAKKQNPRSKSLKGGTANPSKPVETDKKALALAFKQDPSKENALALMNAK